VGIHRGGGTITVHTYSHNLGAILTVLSKVQEFYFSCSSDFYQTRASVHVNITIFLQK